MEVSTRAWTREQLAAGPDRPDAAPVLGAADVARLVPSHDLWDLWPVRTPEGAVADVAGGQLWMALSSPAVDHPGVRHDRARVALLRRDARREWTHLGPVFPDGASPGSREWAGSAVLDPARGTVTVHYTAAGLRDEPAPTFRQGIYGARARLVVDGDDVALRDWTDHAELVRAEGHWYRPADEVTGHAGFIKAFRDPFRFVDPTTGDDHLLFTASMASSSTDFDGAVGIATHRGGDELDGWEPHPPLLTADGVNNELERPHVVVHDGRYHLFVSTQARTFHPGVTGLTGLYGWVADRLGGPYTPLNGSGLVFTNPPEEPFQAYSWLVLDDLTVYGFVDQHSLGGRQPEDLDDDPDEARRHFGGTLAPPLRIELDGERARLTPS